MIPPGVRGPSRRVVGPVPVDPTGRTGPTRGEAQGPRWRRTSRGLYVPAGVDGSVPEQRIVEHAVRLPRGGAVTGWAALRLLGAEYLDGLAGDGRTRLPVPLCIGTHGNIRTDTTVVLIREPLPDGDMTTRKGIPCTTPERAAYDAARLAPDLAEAVAALDMAMHGEVTSIARLRGYVDRQRGRRGVARVRAALNLASEHSWSPQETRMRLVWLREAGLPPPLVNRPIFDLRGRLLGYPDLLDVDAGLVGEFDGAEHRGAARHSRDVAREELFRRHGLEVFHLTGPDLLVAGGSAARMVSARRRALFLPQPDRRWTHVPPDGWDPGPTLDDRLAYRDVMEEANLAWERDGPV